MSHVLMNNHSTVVERLYNNCQMIIQQLSNDHNKYQIIIPLHTGN